MWHYPLLTLLEGLIFGVLFGVAGWRVGEVLFLAVGLGSLLVLGLAWEEGWVSVGVVVISMGLINWLLLNSSFA